MSYALVSLSSVKAALRIDHSDDDTLLELYIRAASETIVQYLKDRAGYVLVTSAYDDSPSDALDMLGDSPTDSAVPEDIQVATIALVGHYYRQIDHDEPKSFADGSLPMIVVALLRHYRDPALA